MAGCRRPDLLSHSSPPPDRAIFSKLRNHAVSLAADPIQLRVNIRDLVQNPVTVRICGHNRLAEWLVPDNYRTA